VARVADNSSFTLDDGTATLSIEAPGHDIPAAGKYIMIVGALPASVRGAVHFFSGLTCAAH